jgi:hypothetical protein
MDCVIQAEGPVKNFTGTTTLAAVDFAARRGTVLGLRLDEAGIAVAELGLRLRPPSLDDVFLTLTGSATDARSSRRTRTSVPRHHLWHHSSLDLAPSWCHSGTHGPDATR